MSITDSPKLGQPRVPEGTFVVFSFDPLAYAAAVDPEDEFAAEAARHVKRKKYLGLIEGIGPVDLPKLRQNPDIRVVGRAPPQEGEDDVYFTSPKRCIPVHPCTDHPEGRAPLVPSAPLPWPDCYVHTLQLVNAFVSRIHHTNPTNATITPEELNRVSDLVIDDQYGAADDRRAAGGARENAEEASSESSYFSDEEEEGSDSSFSSSDAGICAPVKAFIEVWEDLTVATTLGEPKDVGADIDEIVAIGEDWETRKRLDRRRNAVETSKWAAQVAESGHIEPACHDEPLASDAQEQGTQQDDDLAPEDAVDERGGNVDHDEMASAGSSIIAVDVDNSAGVVVGHDDAEDAHAIQEDRRSETTGASHAHLIREEQRKKVTVASRLKGWFQQMFCA